MRHLKTANQSTAQTMRTPHITTSTAVLVTLLAVSCSKSPSEPTGPATNMQQVSSRPANGLTETAKQYPAWAANWSAFVTELSNQVAKAYVPGFAVTWVSNVNNTFDGKVVTWSGKFIKRSEKGDSRYVRVAMEPEKVDLGKGGTALGSGRGTIHLVLKPVASEWQTWEAVSAGDTVTFTTTLDKESGGVIMEPKCVLETASFNRAGTWELEAWVNTKGGACLKSQRAAKK